MQRDFLFFDLPGAPVIAPIDKTVGVGNGRFLGDVANGMSRAKLIERWKAGEYPDLHDGLAKEALATRGLHNQTRDQ